MTTNESWIGFWTLARIIYSLAFAVICWYIYGFLETINQNRDCPLADNWRVSNGKLIASLLIAVALVNVVIPASKFISTLPIIGSSYVLLFVLAVFMLVFMVNRLSVNIMDDPDDESDNEYSECYLEDYSMLLEWFSDLSFMNDIVITVIVCMIFFYL